MKSKSVELLDYPAKRNQSRHEAYKTHTHSHIDIDISLGLGRNTIWEDGNATPALPGVVIQTYEIETVLIICP